MARKKRFDPLLVLVMFVGAGLLVTVVALELRITPVSATSNGNAQITTDARR